MSDLLNIDDILGSMDGISTDSKEVKKEDTPSDRDSPDRVEKKPIKAWKVVLCVLIGLVISGLIYLITGVLYTNYIRFPAQEEIITEQTGAYALENYEKQVHNQEGITKDDFLVKEIEYANSNDKKLSFIKSVVNTLHYEPFIVNAKNIFGNDMIDRGSMNVVKISSPVDEGEKVTMFYVDYKAITFDEEKLNNLISDYELTKDNVNYSNVLVDMFCDYVTGLDKLPITTVQRVPNLIKDGDVFRVTDKEDEYLDKLFFSSDDFIDCEMRFTEAVGKLVTGKDLTPTEDWTKWNNLSEVKKEEEVEPLKYGKLNISLNWCGAYYLTNDYYIEDDSGNRVNTSVKPQLGDGSFESPASLGTSVITYVVSTDSKGELVKKPIRIEMTDFGVSEDAINWFQSKHIQNRGYILDTGVQYCYYVFKITNLSSEKLTVYDNSSLCDKNGNLSTRTGTVFGLSESITLKPDETGYIESWGRSTELNLKYVIWGADFEKKVEPVWFRVLAGDLEDKSEDKGVYLLKEKETEPEITTVVPSSSKDVEKND